MKTTKVIRWSFKPSNPSKYKNKRVVYDNISFQSQMERDYFVILMALKKRGIVACFERQSILDLPGGIKYKPDFTVFYSNGMVEMVDVKGFETPEFKLKKKLVEAHYPFKLTLITRKDIKKIKI